LENYEESELEVCTVSVLLFPEFKVVNAKVVNVGDLDAFSFEA
jgi:hypothetical protein